MKRTGNLFEQILDRDNLRLAFHLASRGKRWRAETRAYADRLEERLSELAEQLRAETVPLGRCHQFVVYDPKERIITAPCFAERVLHHAVMTVCEPVLERRLIAHTFACRKGKGRLKALDRARHYCRHLGWYLKLDIRKYFDSIPHAGLLERLSRVFKDRRLLRVLERIVPSFRGPLGRGVPIGSLTSQHLANFYLSWFDRHVKEVWRLPGYVRYMDDMVLWSDDREELRRVLPLCGDWLQAELGLELKPTPYLNRVEHGLDFLGCRVFPDAMILNRRSRVRFARKLKRLEEQHAEDGLSERECQDRVTALVAFTRTPGLSSWHFRRGVLQRLEVSGHKARTG